MKCNVPTFKAPKVKIPNIKSLPKPADVDESPLPKHDFIIGLDMSVAHTGYCMVNVATGERREGVFEPNPSASKKVKRISGMERLVWLREHVARLVLDNGSCPLVMIEGYAFSAKGSSGIDLGELGGVIRILLYDNKIPYIEIPPTQLKKFVSGRGGAKKEHMLMETLDRWGVKFLDDNTCDAFGLMQIGRAITGAYESNLIAPQKEVVSDVIKTYRKKHPLFIVSKEQ